jgi:hypothetical protein
MTEYKFTHHILNEAMPARNLTEDDVLRVMKHGSSWRQTNLKMRTRMDDLTVCWAQEGDTKTLITIFDTTNTILSK